MAKLTRDTVQRVLDEVYTGMVEHLQLNKEPWMRDRDPTRTVKADKNSIIAYPVESVRFVL